MFDFEGKTRSSASLLNPENIDAIIVAVRPIRNQGRIISIAFQHLLSELVEHFVFPCDKDQCVCISRSGDYGLQSLNILEANLRVHRHAKRDSGGLDGHERAHIGILVVTSIIYFDRGIGCVDEIWLAIPSNQNLWQGERPV